MTTTGGSTAQSGKDGWVKIDDSRILRVKQWSASISSSESAWGDSDSGDFTNRKAARKDMTGTITAVEDGDTPIQSILTEQIVGQIVQIKLYEDASRNWNLTCALLQTFNVTYDMDTKEVVSYTLDFGADGSFAFSAN